MSANGELGHIEDLPGPELPATLYLEHEQQTKLFRDVYSAKKWNLAFRLKPSGSVFGNAISGSNSSYVAELYGVNVQGGEVVDKFLISKKLTQAQGQDFHKFSKRIFVSYKGSES